MFSIVSALLAVAAVLPAGTPMPELNGEFLTGRKATLPAAAHGRVTLLAIGFSYGSRFPVEAYVKQWRRRFGNDVRTGFFEIPIIGGMARMGRWFIDSGMRRGAPREDHEKVITVYGGASDWKRRFNCNNAEAACLVLLDQRGNIRWVKEGTYDHQTWDQLRVQAESLLGAP
ncbi:MAG: hypothetical protein C0504_13865 [Candidatus Solibacter sp.]|nr:hypothetical protein [Candidatus Solibacter sp.]